MQRKTRRIFLKDLAFVTGAIPWLAFKKIHTPSSDAPRIGFLNGAGLGDFDAAFVDELDKLGFTDSKNIFIEKRFVKPNSRDAIDFARELAQMNLSLIVVTALPFAIEVRKNNPAMPMVIVTCPGMVSNGFAESLEHPGGIYTGMDELPLGVTARRLQLLKAAAPAVTRVALLSTTPGRGGHEAQLSEAEKAAAELGVEIKAYRASSLTDLEQALANIATDGMNGMLSFQGGLSLGNRKLIADFAATSSIPAIYQAKLIAEAGGLMAWAPDLIQQFREAAHYVDKILKGAKPGSLPIRHPASYYLTVNLAAAKKIGLTFPPEVMSQATHVLP